MLTPLEEEGKVEESENVVVIDSLCNHWVFPGNVSSVLAGIRQRRVRFNNS